MLGIGWLAIKGDQLVHGFSCSCPCFVIASEAKQSSYWIAAPLRGSQ
jgi:hypothetical protein